MQAEGFPGPILLASMIGKVIVLLSVTLHSEATQWAAVLPNALTSAAPPGAACVLFWPPPGFTLSASGRRATSEPRAWWSHAGSWVLRGAGLRPAQARLSFARACHSLRRITTSQRKPQKSGPSAIAGLFAPLQCAHSCCNQ